MSKDERKSKKPGVFFADESIGVYLPQQTNYEDAERMARDELTRLDPGRQAKRCGARIAESRHDRTVLELNFFNRPVRVVFPAGLVEDPASPDGVQVWERILLLHYFSGNTIPPSYSELISFAQAPSGGFYFEAYRRRTHEPIARAFGRRADLLIEAGERLGGKREDIGDAAVRLPVLPKVPVVAVIHAADDEFPAEAKLLFESTINAFFCTEDIAVLGGLVAGRLIKAAGEIEGKGVK
jgi:hypothetical protein